LFDVTLIAPRDAASLTDLLKPGALPELDPGPIVLWLDDLEVFVRIGEHGMDRGELERLGGWQRPVLVLGTYGGKGQRRLSEADRRRLAEPTSDLLDFATEIPLSGELSQREQAAAREHYPREVVDKMARGVGEYMVAAPRLQAHHWAP